MTTLPILHWNDVYRVSAQKVSPKAPETIDVTQFGALLNDLRDQWPTRPDGTKDGLVLFSGDVFSPSVESSVTRGSHMVPVMNELAPDVSLAGNHDFDFGYPHLTKLIKDTAFPWVLSNIIDKDTSKVPEYLHEFRIMEKAGIKIGIIGLVEREWIATVSSWPPNFVYKEMAEVGIDLSKRLRDPEGEFKCDLVLALTHSRIPNDILLAHSIYALSSSGQEKTPIHDIHGVDLILGGHDHTYYISKGVTQWANYDLNESVLGAAEDHGDILVVKSGTDFRDLSEVILELEPTPPGSARKLLIKTIRGTRHTIQPGFRSSESMAKIVGTLLSSVTKTMKAPVCTTATVLDVRSQVVRMGESGSANWFADVIRHAYDDALCMKGCGGSDGVLICGGTLRGDSQYGPGVVTLGNILEILPFEDPVVVIELTGAALWDALEAGFGKWPAQEGRFPVISGFRVSWDSRKSPGERVLGVWVLNDVGGEEPVPRSQDGRKYKVVTREYMAQGHDGFVSLKGSNYLIDDENGSLMSAIVRKYLLGSHFVRKMAKRADAAASTLLGTGTKEAILREQARRESAGKEQQSQAALRWQKGAELAIKYSRAHFQDQLNVCGTEHMSTVDPFDGAQARKGILANAQIDEAPDEDLLVIHPAVDGRLKDVGRD